MASTTPLLLLLDGILSQDESQARLATSQMARLVPSLAHEIPKGVNHDGNDESSASTSAVLPWLRSTERLARLIRHLMEAFPRLASVPSEHDGSLPLHFAASIGNVQVARLLLENFPGAASQPNSKGKIPLHYAAREGRTNMVVYLLEATPHTAQIQSKKRKLALHFAAGEGHTDVVRALLRVHPEGASLTSGKGKLPLHFAARWGHLRTAQELCNIHPESVSSLDWEGSLPLHDAAREGQLEMAKFLVDAHPQGLSTSNIRGEIPLFPAIRSGNVELVVQLLRAWPRGGKHILQTIRSEDSVHEWDEQILTLCLRGAVENFTGCSLITPQDVVKHRCHQQQDLSSPTSPVHSSVSTRNGKLPPTDISSPNKALSGFPLSDQQGSSVSDLVALHNQAGHRPQTPPMLEITLPRSKSPILEGLGSRKKRSSSSATTGGSSKRPRRDRDATSVGYDDDHKIQTMFSSPFYHLHAALECGATHPVIEHLLKQYPEQVKQRSGLGQFPLHLAVSNCRHNAEAAEETSSSSDGRTSIDRIVDLVLSGILKKFPEAASMRDVYGRLPLHSALMSRADTRVIENLLSANPSSGIEPCGVMRPIMFADALPIVMATEYDCDLGTVYALLRGDPGVIRIIR